MRRVDAEGDSRGVRVQKQESSRARWRLRRATIEWLERRELLSTSTSTLPSPTVLSAPNVTPNQQVQDASLATAAQALTGAPNASSPSVAVDPLNPLKMVATWVDQDPAGYPGGDFTAPITSYIEGAYSINGGQTWTALPSAAFGTGGFRNTSSVNVQQDFSVTPPTTSITVFTETTDASVGFDRSENFYILSSTHNVANSAGVLDLQRFSWTGNGTPTYNGYTPIYSWDQTDSAANSGTVDQVVTPTLAVDSNLPTFTDPTTHATVTDQYSGNIYVAWAEIDSNTYGGIPNFNPNTIRMSASSDQGLLFTHAAYVDDSSNANGHNTGVVTNPPPPQYPLHDASARYAAPQITISQGNGTTVPGGQVTIVYDDYGTVAPLDQILDQTDLVGGTSEQYSPDANLLGPGTFMTTTLPNGTVVVTAQNLDTEIPINVNITDTKFTTLQALDVTTAVDFDTLADLQVVLIPPTAINNYLAARFPQYPGFIALFNGADTTTITGANLGTTSGTGFGAGSGVVFDQEAVRSIDDLNVGGRGTGHFRAEAEQYIEALQGLTANGSGNLPGLNGTWNYEAAYSPSYTATTLRYVNAVTLNFSSGNNPGAASGTAGAEVTIAGKNSLFEVPIPNINPTDTASAYGAVFHTDNTASPFYDGVAGTNVSGRGNITATTQGTIPILPAPVIASDNTLGSFSSFEGRLYVAFTGEFTGAQAGNTDIFLTFSSDGGKTWSTVQQVNDDNAATDGYSGSVAGGPLGRTQYQPQIAVDQSTGNVVLSFLDARNDPSDARVATYIAVSSDGAVLAADGSSGFAADVYANPTETALNAVTGGAVNLGPIPDNQSATGGQESTDGYGVHQALVVTNGRIVPFWTSNQNMAVKTAIVDSILSLTAGPRIISSTQGPVGINGDTTNTTRAADGTTIANTIEITFDRPIDPSSYATIESNTSVFYTSPFLSGTGQKVTTQLPVTGITAVNGNVGTGLGATEFLISFNPSGLASFVGTYSYVVKPTGILDQIRQVSAAGVITKGTVMDQNANGTSGQVTGDDYVVGQPTGFATYAAGTLPIIVSGVHVLSTAAINSSGTVIGTGANDLVLNNTVSAIQVAFDRNVQVSSFTAAQILNIMGPAGLVSLSGVTITPLSVFTPSGQMAYTNGATANLFKITFPIQQVSGSYSLTIGTGIIAADGTGVDSNLNAGLDVLKGTATNGITTSVTYTSTAVPATIAPATANINGTTTPSVTMVPINVPDDFPIQGDTAKVSGLTLSLNITYPNDPNLIAYLLAPDGVTKINLFSNVGAGTNTANFTNTTFSDVASTSVDQAGAPFFGTFLPEAPFANLVTAGLSSLGTWTLVIENAGNSTGTLSSYSLTFQKPVPASGLAEFPDDQSNINFQVFNLAASNALANSTWTAVGPAGITTSTNGLGTVAGTVSSIAVDPSDTTGNTVYVGTAAGGVWKTTDFLTSNPAGPTWLPLTDFGPSFTLNIGGLAVFGRNNDPSQSIVFAGTGFGQERTNSTSGDPNVDFNTGIGGGMLRSMDGGKTWEVVGNFAGLSTYKVVVDPTPNLNGQAVVYAATSGGVYQSLDSGNTWALMGGLAGNATDIILDPASKSPTTGELDRLYVAYSNPIGFANSAFPYNAGNSPVGIYVSTNQGQTLQPVNGELQKDPLIVTSGFPAQPLPVADPVTPNNINSAYIVLAKPALTGNTAENLNYEGWLYAAVENYNGTFQGLYVTKDAGENWTLVQLPNTPGNGSVKAAVPTNYTTGGNSYDPTSSNFNQEGMYNLTITVDPTNPNIVYLGGSQDFQESGLIRVNLTDLYDAHNFTSGSNEGSDGGALFANGQGGVTYNPANGLATYDPIGSPPQSQILNLRYAPNNGTPGTSPFLINSTLVTNNASVFVNNGTGVTWSLFDEPLKANPGDATGSTNLHEVIDYVDPTTGDVRMMFADDLGIFTALVNPDGTLNNGIGTDESPNYSRNGNLQDEQFFNSAAEPSLASSTAAGAEFFASGQNTIAAQSDANVLTDGNLTWDNSAVLSPSPTSPRNTAGNSAIVSSDRSGVGIATDQTGATISTYEFDVPILGGNLTDFFRVNQFGQTTGLADNVNQDFPADGYRGDAHQGGVQINPVAPTNGNVNVGIAGAIVDGQIPEGDFTVNPLNGNQILIASATGNLYETTNQGILWTPIGSPADFGADADLGENGSDNDDGNVTDAPIPIQVSAIAYGAPDPNATGGVGNLNNFIYVGTSGVNYSPYDPSVAHETDNDNLLYSDGHIFVTQAGGQGWTDISKGLDGSSVVGIYPDPDRGSHAAYAVTLTGVFYSPDTIGLAASGQTVWTNITSNLPSLQRNVFGSPTDEQSVLAGFSYTPINPLMPNPPPAYYNLTTAPTYNSVYNSEYGGLTDIVADYRYEIPAPTNATEGTNIFYPVLYASGYGGVFRSIDNGTTWTVFPNMDFDGSPVDGGYLPNVDVTNLQLVLGDINPDTGHAVQATGDPEVLLATTFGRGDFAIRLAPDIIPTSIQFDTTLPAPNGSDSSGGADITNVLEPYLDGVSEVSNFGDTVTIHLYDESPGPGFGKLLGTGTTNALGQFVVQIIDNGTDPSFFTSSVAVGDKIVGIQATDSSGASGNMTLFKYTLDLITPVTPETPVLEATYDTGRFNNDDLTNLSVPAQAGPGAPLTIVTPTFDVTTSLPQANPLTPDPITLTIELLRATSPNGPFFLINSTETGTISADGSSETYMLTDADVATQAAAGIDETFYYEALQIDLAGNVSTPASNVLPVTIDTITPAAPTGISLVTTSNSSPPEPVFSVTGVPANDQVLLYRSIGGGVPILVSNPNDPTTINSTNATATLQVTDTTGAFPDGVYTYFAAVLDVYGNYSPLTPGLVVTINTQAAPAVPILEAAYDTGRYNNDDVTDIAVPAPTPGSTPNFVAPIFDVNPTTPPAGQPAIAFAQLFRFDPMNPAAGYVLVGKVAYTGSPAMISDVSLQALALQGPIDQDFLYEADVINAANIESPKSPPLTVLVDTITPPTLPAAMLDPASNSGLNQSQLITNVTNPTFDATNLAPGDQLLLYRSTGGKPATLVGTGPINATNAAINAKVTDTSASTPNGVYQYFVVQQDLAGNISAFSMPVTVTISKLTPVAPTIALLMSDDTGLPSHPNVTNVNMPHFTGTAPYVAGATSPTLAILIAPNITNPSTWYVAGTTSPASNGTYLAQVTSALPDGVYNFVARTEDLAGNFSYSPALTITILHTGPQIVPTLQLLPADDTGIKGDGVTSNHNPRFTGVTDKGDTVSLYAVVNGVLQGPEATTTSSTVNGTFTFRLPFSLTDGTTELVAQTSDIANNKGLLSSPYTVRITTTTGDYLATGAAQLTVFDPLNETYYIQNIGGFQVDTTVGRDVPVQYDYNGDGVTDLAAYRYNTAEYYGFVSNSTSLDQQFGPGGASLPVSGFFGGSGTFVYGSYVPTTGTWYVALPQPGGLVVNFGVPRIDIPTPAVFDGNGQTELAVFRPSTVFGNDADSYTVIGPNNALYTVSFTNPAVTKLGFVYKAGDLPAPADYDGVGHDEFAIYRPSTGQFFILNTPNVNNPATWTMRTVTLNLPGGPNANDVPASEDYDGDGKADPTVYRPSNSTFYELRSSTGIQQNIQFGPAGVAIAAAGPLLYRLGALTGIYKSTGGYISSPGGGVGSSGFEVHALSVSPSATTTPSAASANLATTIALASPIAVTTPTLPVATASATPKYAVTVGASTPTRVVTAVASSKSSPASGVETKGKKVSRPVAVESKAHQAESKANQAKAAKAAVEAHAKAAVKPHSTASSKATKSHATAAVLAATSLQHLVMATKGRKKD